MITDIRYRKLIIDEIQKGENKERKARSYKQYRVMSDDYSQYVAEKLAGRFDAETVIEMPKVSSINIANKITEKTAVVYKKAPKRTYTNLSEQDEMIIDSIYKDGKLNAKLRTSNKSFKMQNQNLLQLIPKKGKLVLKSLKGHQYDVIPMDDDPEEFKTIILSVFDRELVDQPNFYEEDERSSTGYRGNSEIYRDTEDYSNQEIADDEDYQASLKKFVVWDLETKTNFLMDGRGYIKVPSKNEFVMTLSSEDLEEITSNYILEFNDLPFIDVSKEKDFTYFVRKHHSMTDFTIEFNAAFSDFADTNHIQSKSLAVLKGPADLLANEIKIGSHLVLKLVKEFDQNGREIDMDFQYVNPSPDMQGAKDFIESFLALYLSSQDVDSSEVSMSPQSDRYNSGFERFLALFDTFSASQEDFDLYKDAEYRLFSIIKNWINLAKSSVDLLDQKYITSSNLEEVEFNVHFHKPEEIKSSKEELEEIKLELELGLTSRVKALAKRNNVTEQEAQDIITQIDQQDVLLNGIPTQ